MNWREFVETMSSVDQILREDPLDIYVKMDFSTRDRYRHVVERIAKKSDLSESEVARMAILLARKGSVKNGDYERTAHVGYYLIDNGLSELETLAKIRLSPLEIISRFSSRIPVLIYVGSIFLLTAIFTGILIAQSACRWHYRLAIGYGRINFAFGHKSSGCSIGQLVVNSSGGTSSVAANGFFQRYPARMPHPGCHSDNAF